MTRGLLGKGVAFGSAAMLGWAACAPDATEPSGATGRVVVLAVDGASWRVMDPMLERGELPVLAGLRARGCHGTMTSLDSSASAVIWTSVATGVPPETHGILDFAYEEDGATRLYRNDKLEAHPLWEIASDAGIRVGVTHWWLTYPVVPVDGYLISNHTIPSASRAIAVAFADEGETPERDVARLVHPPELWDVIAPVLRGRLEIGDPPRMLASADLAFAEDEEIAEMTLRAWGAYDPRLRLVYFKGIDLISHVFWGFYQPRESGLTELPNLARGVAQYGSLIPAKVRHTDALVGELLETLTPNDVIVLLSDHGFGARSAFQKGLDPEAYAQGFHRGTHGPGSVPPSRDGIFVVAGGPVTGERCPERISLYDVAPTVLYLLGQPVPSTMSGRALLELFHEDYRERNPLESTGPAPPRRTVPASATPGQEEVERNQIEALRALGYLE